MVFPEFGPFAIAFEKDGLTAPGYLTLLHLASDDAQIVIGRIEEALAVGDPRQWAAALLAGPNWRPHLVAAIAYLLSRSTPLDPAPLWGSIDAGSWVTPQLVVTALFSDPMFPLNARSRVDRRCPVNVLSQRNSIERHITTGPGDTRDRSAKMLASILGVCPCVPSLAACELAWRAEAELQAMLREDASRDRSECLTTSWMSSVRAQFLKRGIVLSPVADEAAEGRGQLRAPVPFKDSWERNRGIDNSG
ncbi:MAG TPA: hypothetical protein VF590_26860 [Isosphaeraceae bacterium]